MYRLLLALCGCVLIGLCGCGGGGGDGSLNQALKLAQSGRATDLEKAVDLIADAREAGVEPTAQLFELEALCLSRLDEYHQALQPCREGLELFPNSFILYYVMGQSLYATGQFGEAVAKLQEAVKLRPDDANASLLLALAARRDNHARGDEYFRRLMSFPAFKQHSLVHNEWAMWHLNQGNAAEAQKILVNALTLPNVPHVVYRNIAVIYDQYLQVAETARVVHYRRYLNKLPPEADPAIVAEVNSRIAALSGR